MAELDALIGLANVKAEVRRLTSMLQVQQMRAERGLPVIETSHHLVFTGNPGTGKTTVARLLSQIYRAIGVVAKGQLVETDRSRLVAGFVGQTALKTTEVLQSSLGGMLLIDEAYALARGGDDDFGREAIDTLVKFMEDHRDDLAIVAAGYTAEMQQFIDSNPGLKSRFTRTINFPTTPMTSWSRSSRGSATRVATRAPRMHWLRSGTSSLSSRAPAGSATPGLYATSSKPPSLIRPSASPH